MEAIDPSSIRNALNRWWQRYIASGDLTILLIVFVLLLQPALALQAAGWPITLNIAIPTLVISVLFGYALARSRYNELVALFISLIYGIVGVLLIAAIALDGVRLVRGIENVIGRTIQWGYDAATGGINQDPLVFTLVVALLFWFFGYNATWHVFRIDRVWRVIIPPAMILIVNMVVYAGDTNLDLYLLLFIFMALLLVVQSNLDAREWDWYVHGVRVPKNMRQQFITVGAAISLVALVLAWAIPSTPLQDRLDRFQEFLAREGFREMAEVFNRLVEPVESDGPATADYYGGNTLNLGGAITLGNQEIMRVTAPNQYRHYWKSRVFERYQNGSWSPSATRRVPDINAPIEIDHPDSTGAGRAIIQQQINMQSATRLYYYAPHPLTVDGTGRIDLYRTNGDQDDPDSAMNVSVIRPLRVIEAGDSYTAQSAISTASAFDLRTASTDYPAWVTSANTSAGDVSPRTAALARQIVDNANAVTVYDQAKAIEIWLRSNIAYNESIPSPPVGADAVDWFLYEIQEGYCTYYATSMVVMLRSLGIPARMAAGFAEGEYDTATGQYIVRERDAHTWVEVYFPEFGWVPFEPTAAQSPLDREGDLRQQEPQVPESPALPTLTLTPTQIPPTATSQLTPTPPDDTPPQDNNDAQPPTVTPTPSPTPTATPVIIPTQSPTVQPPEAPTSGLLNLLLPALIIALVLLAVMILLVLIALFIWWWWEWRGMGGMSPVARAYARLERYIALIGIRADKSDTPEERRITIVKQLPRAERPVTVITRTYMDERYGNRSQAGSARGAQNAQRADEAWRDTRPNILRRWLRRLNPFSRD